MSKLPVHEMMATGRSIATFIICAAFKKNLTLSALTESQIRQYLASILVSVFNPARSLVKRWMNKSNTPLRCEEIKG